MNKHSLDQMLEAYRKKEIPSEPTNLRQNVWREIRLRQSAPVSSALRYSEFLTWFRGSLASLVAPALAVALFMSVGLTMLDAQTTPHQRVQQALGLQVFSHQASPLTRLAENP
jgi:hypothetical protein